MKPSPLASEAAHAALNVRRVALPPGVKCHQASFGPWISSESPPGDQLKEGTALLSNSSRGNPRSLTIHNPPAGPSGPAGANAIQWLSGCSAPVGNLTS